MIKANELRIGNYMQDRKWYLCEVTRLSKDVDEIKIESIDNAITYLPCEPIPLTEQWLLDLGFVKEERESVFIFSVYVLGDFTFNTNHGHFWIRNSFGFFKEPKHVHELQNLFFSITGQELTLKQPII